MIARGIDAIAHAFPLREKDAGAFAAVKAGPMRFEIHAYHAAGLGHVSSVCGSAMLGLMQMETLVINATERDMPLLSFDAIRAAGKHTLILELYNTLAGETPPLGAFEAVKTALSAVPDHALGDHWYDSLKLAPSLAKRSGSRDAAVLVSAWDDYLAAYLSAAKALPPLADASAKQAAASAYVEGLLAHGGPSTDAFKKAIGEEKTKALFRTVVFGTEG